MYITNNRWHKIYTAPNGNYFILNGKRYYLSGFVRCHNNQWIQDVYPYYIHAFNVHEYHNPMFIEVSETKEAVRVYFKEEN